MDSSFRSKSFISLFILTSLLYLNSAKPAQALEECYNSIPVVLSGAVSDPSGIDWGTLTITVNGETPEGVFTNTLTGEWTATFSSDQVVEGTNTLAVSVVDDCGSGNYSSTTRSFRVDTIPPNVWITSPTNGTLICTGSIVISYAYDDADTTCEERLDFWPWQPCGAGLPPIPDGPHTYEIRITDFCDNSDTDSVNFTVDGTPPTVDITSPTDGSTIYSSTVVVKGTASDFTSGLSQVCVSLDGGTCQTADLTGGNWSYTFNGVIGGPHSLVASAFDYCGYVGNDSVTVYVEPVTSVCSISSVGPNTGCPGDAFTVDGADFGETEGSVSLDAIPVTVISWGDTSIVVSAPGGDYSNVTVTPPVGIPCSLGGIYSYDNEPPTGLAAYPAGGSYCATSVTLSCDDPGATIYYTLDGSGPNSGSPVYTGPIDINLDTTLKFMAVDICGNQSATVTEVYDIDTEAVVSIISPVDGSIIAAGDVTVSGKADTDITTVIVISDQGHVESSGVDPGSNWSVVLMGVTVPSIFIAAIGTDDCGNVGSDSVTVPVIPPCSITSIGPTTGCPGDVVTISGSDFGPNTGTVSFNGTAAIIISWSDTSIEVEAPGGDYSNVTVTHSVGIPCSLSGTYSYDNEPPTGLAAAPAGGSYCMTPIMVSLSASDGTIYYTFDGSEPTTGSPVYTGPIDISVDTTLKFMAVDACGNQSATVTEVYDIDTEAVVTITEPVDGVTVCAGDVTVTGTADTDIATVIVISDQGHLESSGVDAGGKWSVILTGITVPSIFIAAIGMDDCGNIGSDSVMVPVYVPFVWYVDADSTGNNNGTSWADAFIVIQDAANIASRCDMIWVAEGTYTSDSTATVLTMKAGVKIYGGFTGTESSLLERDAPATHPTILDGEGTSYHVVVGASYARLDGFIITGGNAYGSGFNQNGGGMYNSSVNDLVVANCTFIDNSATVTFGRGGGMYNKYVTGLVVANCTFSGNSAGTFGRGGGICNYNCSPKITNCTFSVNWGTLGGGMYNYENSSPTITNCTFIGNSADYGGGICNVVSPLIGPSQSSPTITNCIFSGNSATNYGGGMYNSLSLPNITNCIFSGNSAGGGGGMYNSLSLPTITNCIFSGNSAGGGGGMFNGSSWPEITNCIFSGNSAEWGGGMYNAMNSSPTVTNCTFNGNSATEQGGGIYNLYYCSPTITNCILWDDTAPTGPEISLYSSDYPSTLNISHSDIQGGQVSVYVDPGCTLNWGAGNIGDLPEHDPLFVTGPNGDYYLSQPPGQGSDSPCVDAGSDTAANLGLDDKTTRTDNVPDSGQVDMGYHYEPLAPGSLVASPPGGVYCSPGPSVTLSCDDLEATIYYTLDGSGPTTGSSVYTVPITISVDTTLKAIAVDQWGNLSEIMTEVYDIDTEAVVSITYPVDGVTNAGDVMVTGTADTDITTVTVTSDQGHIESSDVIDGDWSVVLTGVVLPSIAINAAGTDDCGNVGGDSVMVPIMPPPCSITSVGPTTGCPGDSVTIAGISFRAIEGILSFNGVWATITSWDEGSIVISAPGGDYTFVTVTLAVGGSCSLAGIYSYDNLPPSDPVASPAGGSYCPTTVTLTTSDGTIYYTTDGSEPTTGSPVYVGPVDISGDTTLKAIAADQCGNLSGIMTNVYMIDIIANVTITYPENGKTIGTGNVLITGIADDDITSVFLGATQGTWTDTNPVVSGGAWSSTLQAPAAGAVVTITVTGVDVCGNIGSDSVTVRVPFIWYVDADAVGNNDGTSWMDAFTVIQDAVDVASSSDGIWVAEGTYTNAPTSTVSVLTMKAGVEIYGGFTGTESDLSERGDPADHPTILDGEGTSYHVVRGNSNARLDGFTVTGGNANGSWPDFTGGGMCNDGVTGMVVANCTFSNNQANSAGGGMFNWNSSLEITNCTFIGNSANAGGGMYNYETSLPMITNCTFIGNSANRGGGIFNGQWSSPTITNCTFIGNSANSGGGMYNFYTSLPTITNCIMWGDSPEEIYNEGTSSPTVTYSDIEGSYTGTGNINADPLFVNVPDLWDVTTADGTTTTIEVADATLYAADDVIEIEDDGVARTVLSAIGTTVTFTPALSSNSTAGMIVENWGPGATDLDEDFHLSQIAAGQGSDSPCVDAGSDWAANLGMDDKTTRTDGVPDSGWVDMGYHYEP